VPQNLQVSEQPTCDEIQAVILPVEVGINTPSTILPSYNLKAFLMVLSLLI
jgi:hypothetical protein